MGADQTVGELSFQSKLVNLAQTPKPADSTPYSARGQLRHAISSEWAALPTEQRSQILGDCIVLAQKGQLSPTLQHAEAARQNMFPKGAGPAINWLAATMNSQDAHELPRALPAHLQNTANAVRTRKPLVGVVDPLFRPIKPYLKNHVAIGTLPHGQEAQSALRIGIIGEGLTGKLTGFMLNQVSQRFQFEFFDKGPHAGGRMCTHVTQSGALFEGGAMRLPRSGKTIHHFLQLLGIGRPGEATLPFPNMGSNVDGKIQFRGKTVVWPANQLAPDHAVLKPLVERFEEFCQSLRAPLDAARANHDYDGIERAWNACKSKYLGRTVEDMLKHECGFTPAQIDAFAGVGLGTGGIKAYIKLNVSALEIVREITADLTKGQGLLPSGTRDAVERLGTQHVLRADGTEGTLNARSVRHYNTHVHKVALINGKPTVAYETAGMGKAQQAFDMVIVTPPPGSAKNIDLSEVLDARTIDAVRNCQMMGSSKLVVETDAFWINADRSIKKGMVTAMQSDQAGLNSAYFVAYPDSAKAVGPATPVKRRGVVYLDYRWESRNAASIAEYFDAAVSVMHEMAPQQARLLKKSAKNAYVKDWALEGGAFRELSATGDRDHQVLAEALDPRKFKDAKAPVLYASAESILGGYTETAAIEAFRAAGLVVEHFGGKLHPDAPEFKQYSYTAPDQAMRDDSAHNGAYAAAALAIGAPGAKPNSSKKLAALDA